MAINFSAQFIVNEKTSTRVLRLTDTSTGFTLSKGNFIVTFPDGSVVSNTDFSSPQISAPGGNTSISLITDTDNTVLTGTYVINYVALDTSLNEYNKTETFDFNWEKPAKAIINDSDVVLPEVQFKDLTAYETSGSFTGTLTRNFYTTTPSTSEVGVITKTSVGDILTPSNASKYYEGIYLVKSDISVAYTHTSKSWLTVAYTDLLQETFDVREVPTQNELVVLMNNYKAQIEEYKSTNPSQYEIMNEQYDLVLALYSHIIARYETGTLDGSKAILDQLLGLLPPTEPYTYKATQMLPFTINFSTSLTGSGTTGTIPKFTGVASIGDSIIKESGGMIGVGKTPTAVLDVNGAIKGTSIVKSGGTSSEFLKADGSVDANTYLTTGSASSNYQPLDGDLTAIAGLAGTIGLLRKTSANTWELDTSVYLTGINSGQVTTALGFTPENVANKGVNNGYAGLDSSGKVPSTQLPSYVDDVIEAANLASLPATGETGKIYVTLDTNKIYRWTGSVYVEVSPTVGTIWGGITGTLSNQTDLQSALDAKQGTLTLTTLNTSGPATLNGSTLNIPIYQGGVTSFNTRTGAITLSSTDVTTALTYTPYPTPTGDTTQYIAGDGSLITFPIVGTAGTLTREVRNTTGATLTKGTVVYISGANGNKPTVSKAIATGDSTSAQTFGIVQANIAHNANGNVVCVGDITGLDTSAFDEGTQLYLSSTTAGTYTSTKQLAPNHLVYIGVVTRQHNTQGQIEVNIQNGYELYELHDVSITSVANNQGLFYESSTSLWKNKSIATVLGYIPQAQLSGTGFVKFSGTTVEYINETYLTTAGAAAQYQLIGSYASGSGESTRLARWISTSDLSVSVIYDDGTNIGIGQAPGAFKLDVTGTLRVTGAASFSSSVTASSFSIPSGSSTGFLKADGSVDSSTYLTTAGAAAQYQVKGSYVAGSGESSRLARWISTSDLSVSVIYDDGTNIGIGQAPGAFKLDVTGTIRVTGAATFSSSVTATSFVKSGGSSTEFLKANGSVDANTYLTTSGAAAQYQPIGTYVLGSGSGSRIARWLDGSTLAVAQIWDDGTNIGIGGAPGAFKLDVTGTLRVTGAATFSSSVTASSFAIPSGSSTGFLKANGSVDLNTYLTTTSAASQYQPIGTYAGGSGESSRLARWTSSSNLSVAQIWDDGTNIGIGQAPGSYKLDVTGTARITSTLTLQGANNSISGGNELRFNRADNAIYTRLYDGGGASGFVIDNRNGDGFNFQSAGTSQFRIAANGAATFGATIFLSVPSYTMPALTASQFGYASSYNVVILGNSSSAQSRSLAFNVDVSGNPSGAFSGNGSEYIWRNTGSFITPNSSNNGYNTIFAWSSTGAATFSSSLSATTGAFSGDLSTGGNLTSTGNLTLNTGANRHIQIGSATNYYWRIRAFNDDLEINGGSNAFTAVKFYYPTGAATFSSNVTAVGNISTSAGSGFIVGGTSFPFNPSSTRGSLHIAGSTDRLISFGTNGNQDLYIYSASSISQIVSTPDLALVSGGSERMRITSAGNVGIGTSSPQTLLSIETSGTQNTISPIITSQSSGTTYTGLYSIRDGAGDQRGLLFQVYTANVGLNERMRITSAGNVGIGTTAPGAMLHINQNASDIQLIINSNSTTSPSITQYRINNSSGWEIGMSSASNSYSYIFSYGTFGTSTAKLTLTNGGALAVTSSVTATSFFESSDKTIKTLIEDNYQAKGIETITPKLYLKNGVEELGYFAQDVQAILPSAVTTGENGLLNLSYREVHTAKIARLEKEVEILKAQLNLN